jgi:hypothetical protein
LLLVDASGVFLDIVITLPLGSVIVLVSDAFFSNCSFTLLKNATASSLVLKVNPV